ncbi:phage tail tape measure protein [Streptomyces sp. NPDC087894]|uniref:phage tail tape measure protein n=1 Tax=Streptomyces sp. NPDC087894 TaxID=3365816 RepID=UPI003830BFC8
MALVVGELTGTIRIDDGEVRPALRRTEGALNASGQRMADDAQQAGQQAGQALGEGLTRAADGSIRDARGRFVASGRQAGDAAGDAIGDGLTRGADEGADDAVRAAEGGLSRLQMAAAGIGVAAGAALMAGMQQMLEQSQITGRLGAQLGKTPAEAQRYGKIAGQLYADAVTADFQGAADAISATMRSGLLPPDATNAQIKQISTGVSDLANTFELDLGQAANAVGQIMKGKLAPDAQTALDIITHGMTTMGPRADDIADTFNEYSPIFARLGLNAQTATGLMSQGLKANARDTDVVADALKEFQIRATDGSKSSAEGFKALGLNAEKTTAQIAAGGEGASKGLQTVLDRLRGMKDPVEQNAAAVALFGTKAEDLGGALWALDPSKATAALGDFAGASDKAGNALRDNAGVKVEQFKRGLQQGIVNVLGTKVIPALSKFGGWAQRNSGTLKVLAAVVGGPLVAALVLMGVTATISAARTVAAWVSTGASALTSAGTQVLSGARVVGAWILMGVQSMIQGARMAAAWVIAMGPVGWVIAAIVGLGLLIWANWDKIKAWTLAAWDWIWNKIKSVGQLLLDLFLNFTLYGLIIKHWDSIKAGTAAAWDWVWGKIKGIGVSIVTTVGGFVANAVARFEGLKRGVATKATALVAYVAGLPGRLARGIGNLTSLLLEKGKNVVQGLWNGIQSMGPWIAGKLAGWAKSKIPGPIAKALGIASPSKVTTAQGRWIGRGLVDGLTGTGKRVKSAAQKLADIVRDGLAPGKKRAAALGKISSGSKALQKLANQETKLAARMKAASKSLADQVKARDKLSADVTKGVLDSANITSNSSGLPVSAQSILSNLTDKMRQAQQFAKQLAVLRKKGIRGDLIAQIAQAGVEQGSGAAAALAMASSSQIKQINSTQGALVTAAGQAGNAAGTAMYGAGIQAAAGLVKGLQSQQSAIEKQMTKLAKGMASSIKKALGIHSPSKVMADQVGRFIPAGLIEGVQSGVPALDQTMASLVTPPTPAGGSMAAPAGAYGGDQAPVVIEIRSSGNRHDDYILESLRKSIKVRGRNAQLVLAGKE